MKLGKASDTKFAAQVTVMTETVRVTRPEHEVTSQEVERVLFIGRLLLSVLTPDELETLRQALSNQQPGQNGKSQNR